jgi:transcriptional regulator with XRE-family HTH domain
VGPAPPARGGSHLGSFGLRIRKNDIRCTGAGRAGDGDLYAIGARRDRRKAASFAHNSCSRAPRSPHIAALDPPLLWKPVLRDSQHTPTDPAASLGARVRELRRDRGLTLKALGRDAGLSHPFLSQLERGLARPSVTSVERIAAALDVPVSTLWTSPRQRTVRVVRAGDGKVRAHQDSEAPGGIRAVSPDRTSVRVREWSGGSRAWSEEDTTTGEVMVYVMRGAIEVNVDGEIHALRQGDSLFFDGRMRHRLRRRGGTGTRALYVACG